MKRSTLVTLALCASFGAHALDDFEFSTEEAFADFDIAPAASDSFDSAIYTLGYRFAGTNLPSNEFSTLANQAYLAFEQARAVGDNGYFTINGEASLAFGDSRQDNTLFSANTQLSELHYEHSLGIVKTRIGLQNIAWGEVSGTPVLDIASPNNAANYSTNLAASRVSQWMLSANSYFTEQFELQGFINLKPEYNALPGDPFAQAEKITEQEFGVRATYRLVGADISLYVGKFFPNQPSMAIVNGQPAMLSPEAQWLAGSSASMALGSVLLAADSTSTFVEGTNSQNDVAISVEYATSFIGSITAATHLTMQDKVDHALQSSVRWSKSFVNETFTLSSALTASDTELQTAFAGVQHKWQDSANWQLGVGGNFADEVQPFGFLVFEQQF
ncbi:DUF1302 family protein [Salinibius halmophilus]|uniref:DUF1302 family protein n=1 Tax=Salinibius halmophilus TaxID=1853216 RepID=UPI000E66E3B5|nr:DUF1302 family protein [Salinibius halmophilus]